MQETRNVRIQNFVKKISVSLNTDAGCVREANEDNGRHVAPSDIEVLEKRGTLTVVADGMGGHLSGEVASQMAIDLISDIYYSELETPISEALRNAVEQANAQIYETSISDEQFFGMGTTVIALVLCGNLGWSAHVGDSRLYQLRGSELELLTMDHSQVFEMVKGGIISWEEAEEHEDKNIILRAVGTQPNVEVELSDSFPIELGDEFLLCSDGLCDMLISSEIREIWLRSDGIYLTCENLISKAKELGGHDNITVGIVRVDAKDDGMGKRETPITREIKGLVQ